MLNKIIKTMRKNAELNQQQLAKKCNISNTTISGYETGYREPDFETLYKIASQCGYEIQFVSKNDVLTIDNIKRKEI